MAGTTAVREEIETLVRARYPLTYIVSFEEARVEEQLLEIARALNKELWLWTITKGFVHASQPRTLDNTADPLLALDAILRMESAVTSQSSGSLYVLKDFHPFLGSDQVVAIRKLRDVTRYLLQTTSSVFILAPVLRVPPDLEKEITVLEFPLPSEEEINQLLDKYEKEHQHQLVIRLDPVTREAMVKALLGLTYTEAENVLSRALVTDRRLDASDLPLIIQEKEQIIKKSGILEFYPLRESLDEVGGLNELKNWLHRKRCAFDARASAFGIRTPKGVLLIGVPGCGKSLTAKAVANAWKMPLLRFDLGKVFGMYVGQSEENTRRAIRTAESIAPCILWIDELEKGFSGLSSSDLDSGVVARVFGTFITWLQEKTAPVYVVATANDVSRLPPELLRKGRFDEIFFVDLPMEDERKEIFRVHLRIRRRDPDTLKLDLQALSRATEGYTGADIEGIIDEVLERAFTDGERQPSTEDFLKVIDKTLPLSATMKERIEQLRSWAATRARPASTPSQHVRIPTEGDFRNKRRLEY